MLTAKIVTDTNSQVLELPEVIRIEGSKVCIRKIGERVMLISVNSERGEDKWKRV